MGYVGDYVYEWKHIASGTDTVTKVTSPVGKDKTVRVISAYVTNYTTANKALIIGKRDTGGNDIYLKQVNAANTYSIALDQPVILREGESMIGIVESPTGNDVLYFSFYGEQYKRVQ
jgi:hypothetical protein